MLSFFLAALLAHLITPMAMRLARDYGLVDKPDGKLKTHENPVPYLGGMSIYLAFLLTLGMTYTFNQEVLALLLAGTIVVLLGLIDDLGALSPRAKFIGQSMAILALMKAGILIEIIYLPTPVQYILTYFWLLGLTNAFNLIDIMDGLSTGVGMIGALFLLIVALVNGNFQIAVLTATLAGSLLGFMRYNSAPARIYLGDTGSLFIGLNLGALAMIGRFADYNQLGVIAPAVILGVPIFDTLFVMYIRSRRGVSMFLGSPDHFALRLRKWRFSIKQTVWLSYGASVFLGICGLAIIFLDVFRAFLVLALLVLFFLFISYRLKRIDMSL